MAAISTSADSCATFLGCEKSVLPIPGGLSTAAIARAHGALLQAQNLGRIRRRCYATCRSGPWPRFPQVQILALRSQVAKRVYFRSLAVYRPQLSLAPMGTLLREFGPAW